MKRKLPLKRQIICEVCGIQYNRSALADRDICYKCYQSETKTHYPGCGHAKRGVVSEAEFCPRCLMRPKEKCVSCSRITVLHNKEARLCQLCDHRERQRIRQKDKLIKVECSVCGKVRASALLNKAICPPCWTAQVNGQDHCIRCNKIRIIYHKSKQLCRQCAMNDAAVKRLHLYIEHFASSFSYNNFLFDLLASTIKWEEATRKTEEKFRAFGSFLETHQLVSPLTWEQVEEILPPLGPTKRDVPKLIRASLFDLGHLLAAKKLLEPYEIYVAKRNALLPVKRSPEQIQPLLQRYITWLLERKSTFSNVRNHLDVLAAFWSWCNEKGIDAPERVQTIVVNEYFLTLYWQWQCSVCQSVRAFDPQRRQVPQTCETCGALRTITQVKRWAQNTVRGQSAALRVFFDWCKIQRLVVANPVQRRIAALPPTIQHYPLEVIKQLCTYLVKPEADPQEALVLYLIIFHALSVWELQHAQLPTVLSLHGNLSSPPLAEAYSILVPRPAPSLGDHSPGRPGIRVDFPSDAVVWLKPLLLRFEQQQQTLVKNSNNRYLFVSSRTGRHITPIGTMTIWRFVQDASLRAVGVACNPNLLRKTAGVLFADRAGGAILGFMGWEEHQAFIYTWAEREIVHPREVKPVCNEE